MKKISQTEIFENVSKFLKSKGVTLNDSSYTTGIRKTCDFLTHITNQSQETLDKTSAELATGLDKIKQKIHEKTVPKQKPVPPTK